MDIHCAIGFCVTLLVIIIVAVAVKAFVNYMAPSFSIPQPIVVILGCIALLLLILMLLNCAGGGSYHLFHW